MKNIIAGAAAISLLFYEMADVKEPAKFFRAPYTGIDAKESALAPCNHTHSELRIESQVNVTNSLAASGSQRSEEKFRLFIHPASMGFQLVGHPLDSKMNGAFPQFMYGFCPSVGDLTELLASNLELPTGQIDAIRRTAVAGEVQEIGGSHSPVIRLFRRGELERIGMNFRPPDPILRPS
jgi:hypothetical protein